MRVARTTSKDVGLPPRWMYPSTVTRASYPPVSWSLSRISVADMTPSARMMRVWLLCSAWDSRSSLQRLPMLNGISGTTAYSAPEATAVSSARKPALRPITSTMNRRSWLEAVSLRRMIASRAVFTAVSKPMVSSVPATSLSMVPGMPMTGIPISCSAFAPWKDPSPPITMRPSIPASFIFKRAASRPSWVLKRSLRAVLRIVPPRWMMPPTEARSSSLKSPSINPS